MRLRLDVICTSSLSRFSPINVTSLAYLSRPQHRLLFIYASIHPHVQPTLKHQSHNSMMLSNILALLPFLTGTLAGYLVHDGSFVPDYVLEATLEQIQIDCTSRLSVIFNGTYPGPTLHLREGQTTWIRVYNRMAHNNVTVVRGPAEVPVSVN